MVKGSFQDDYGPGSQNLVRHLAYKYSEPDRQRHTWYHGKRGFYATTQYVYMYMAENGMDEKIVSTEEGYKNSSKDHYYWSRGRTQESSRLLRRCRACGCQPCLKLDQEKCELTPARIELMAGTTPRGFDVVLYPSRPAPEARHTHSARNPLPRFCEGLSVGENIIVRLAAEERDINPDEE